MAWTYKGIEINMLGSSFAAEVDGKRIVKPSLKAAQKEIEKSLNVKALEVILSLPVVILRAEAMSYSGMDRKPELIERAVITGVNPLNRKVQGIDPPYGYLNRFMLPYSPENVKLLEDYVKADHARSEALEVIENLQMSKQFGEKVTYSEAVGFIQKQHLSEGGSKD